MGYTLTIGEGEVVVDWDEAHASIDAVSHSGEGIGAPLNSGAVDGDRGNSISPSYAVWRHFCEDAGISPVFFTDPGRLSRLGVPVYHLDSAMEFAKRSYPLLAMHPGAVALTDEHLAIFEEARARWVARPRAEYIEDGVDWGLRRLDWLCFWARWAIDNCEHPVFVNG